MMRVRLRILNHDALTLWRAAPKVCARGEDFIHNTTRIFGCRKIQIEITFDRIDAADSVYASNLTFDLLGDFLSACWYLNLFSGARFECGRCKKGCRDSPFAAKGNRRPLEFCNWNFV